MATILDHHHHYIQAIASALGLIDVPLEEYGVFLITNSTNGRFAVVLMFILHAPPLRYIALSVCGRMRVYSDMVYIEETHKHDY